MHHRKNYFFSTAMGGAALLFSLTTLSFADEQPSHKYVPNQIIVEYKDSVVEAVDHIVAQKRFFKNKTANQSGSLDTLHSKYKVKAAKPVFHRLFDTKESSHSIRKKQCADYFKQLKTRYPKRSTRGQEEYVEPVDLTHIYVLDLEEDIDVEAAVEEFAQDPNVKGAWPNYLYDLFFTPNDFHFNKTGSWGQEEDDLWGLKLIQAPEAWDVTQGEGIVVAVVDSGLDYNHPDISNNVWFNPHIITDENQDGEINFADALLLVDATAQGGNGNGRIDRDEVIDHMFGWDFTTIEHPPDGRLIRKDPDGDTMDTDSHGSHVAGTIAAVVNNEIGIAGVAPKVKILPLKVFEEFSATATSTWIADAITYAIDHGADVINNSWGCREECPSNPTTEAAVRTAINQGVVVIMAAGNSTSNVSVRSPQNMQNPKPIVVSATTPMDQPTDFTNFGSLVDVAAPGGGTDETPPDIQPLRNILSLRTENFGGIDIVPGAWGGIFSIFVKPPIVNLDDAVFVQWSTPAGEDKLEGEIKLYRVGDPNDQPIGDPIPTNHTHIDNPLILVPNEAGEYEYRFIRSDSQMDVTRSNPFVVTSDEIVEPPPQFSFSLWPNVLTPGQSTTLRWGSNNADTCVAFGDWQGEFPAGNVFQSQVVTPTRDDPVYGLTCTGPGGSTTQYAVVWFGPQYMRQAGTSMSAPHATGVAALILANHEQLMSDFPEANALKPEDVRNIMRISSDSIVNALPDQPIGEGRINAAEAVDTKIFIRGDADCDGERKSDDAILTLIHLFINTQSLACKDAVDTNDDGMLDIADAISTLYNVFLGNPLPEPADEHGIDTTADSLSCTISCVD